MAAAGETVALEKKAVSTQSVVLALACVYLVWGSTYWVMRVAVESLPPFFMAGTRFAVTGTLLLGGLRLTGSPWPTRQQWLRALPVGLLMFVGGNATVAWAEKHVSSGAAAIICGTMPLWAAAFGPFFGEKPTRREWLALALGFLGVVALGLGRELRAEPQAAALVMVAPLSWALGSQFSRRWPLAPGLMSAATQMLTASVVLMALSVSTNEGIPWRAPPQAWAAWAYLCVFGSLVAYSAYTWLLRNTRPTVATSYSYVNPAIAVAVGALFGNESVGVTTVIAVTLIVAATLLVVRGKR